MLARLDRLDVEVIADPQPDASPSPWRTYLECLRRPAAGATHLLVIQDDAVPCQQFASTVLAAVTAQPSRPIALWVGGQPADACVAIRKAGVAGRAWVDLCPWQWFPCVAAVWPAEIAARIVEWADRERVSPQLTRSDDGNLGRFMARHRLTALATVPSLVEHPDTEPSLIGRKAKAGADRGRVACLHIGDRDPAGIRW